MSHASDGAPPSQGLATASTDWLHRMGQFEQREADVAEVLLQSGRRTRWFKIARDTWQLVSTEEPA